MFRAEETGRLAGFVFSFNNTWQGREQTARNLGYYSIVTAGMDARRPPQNMDVLLADKRVRDSKGRDDCRPLAWAGKNNLEAANLPRVGWHNPDGKRF